MDRSDSGQAELVLLVAQLPDAVEPESVAGGEVELFDANVASHDLFDR